MSTIIYPSPIFGPVHSRRLGVSLGINLAPSDGKHCSFDCIYCECGLNAENRPIQPLPMREEVRMALENKLKDMQANGPSPDVITFAGNGEPTSHPHFPEIIDDTIELRNRYFPKAKVSVLSNSTFINRPKVFDALMKVDNNILKLDTVNEEYIKMVDRPAGHFNVEEIIDNLKAFHGHVIIQTMFMKGTCYGENVDNTGDEYVLPWLEAVKSIAPSQVMIYTIDRETPDKHLIKATRQELNCILEMLKKNGISATASY
ncbi:radical SAM protein [uncultured Bacteroides sp.]|uniref:radical SAM protein n=1 Tax=uncultured Bacteroides sp. TaxID=162156 RepID=UPI002AAA87CD|nr:radical SAM protein [uncultured Bacteroides sp.]